MQYIEHTEGDGKDAAPGHGTHVASSVAGEVFEGWEMADCPEVRQAIHGDVCVLW